MVRSLLRVLEDMGFRDDEILHAFATPILVEDLEDGLVMLVRTSRVNCSK
jgi:hypothetical protein